MSKPKNSSKGAVSAGVHSTTRASLLNNARRAYRETGDHALNLQNAHRKGQNPWVTIDNPNKNETNKHFIRVRANELWGNPKDRALYVMKGTAGE